MTLSPILIPSLTSLNEETLQYYQEYSQEYYNDTFRKGQGTEAILQMLSKYGKGQKWLDVGSGPATLFWALMMPEVTQLSCSEICAEGIYVLDSIFRSNGIPLCHKDVMRMYNIQSDIINNIKSIERNYYLFDALNTWPNLMHSPYDIISIFGVFGLSANQEEYISCFQYPKSSLKPEGVLLGANWVRSSKMIEKHGGDNRYITPDLVNIAASRFGYYVHYLSEELISNDPNYDRVIIWCLKPCKL